MLAWSLCGAAAALPARFSAPAALSRVQGRRKIVGAMRGREFPSPPPPSRARPHADLPTAHRVAVELVRPSHAPLRAAYLGLWVKGGPPELSGDADTTRTERRPFAVAHARCSRGVLYGTAATMEHAWPSPLPEQALRGPNCTGRGGHGSLTEPRGKIVQGRPGGASCAKKRVPLLEGRTVADLATTRKMLVVQSE